MNLGLGQLAPDPSTIDVPLLDLSTLPPPDVGAFSGWGASPLGIPGAASGGGGVSLMNNVWADVISGWSKTGQAIARASGGANPTYQQVGPYGSTTMYGGSGSPVNTSILPGVFGGGGSFSIGTILLLAIVGVVIVSAMSGSGRR